MSTEPETVIVTRHDLTGHIDDPVCTCAGCHPEWHTGVRCNCHVCVLIRDTDPRKAAST